MKTSFKLSGTGLFVQRQETRIWISGTAVAKQVTKILRKSEFKGCNS